MYIRDLTLKNLKLLRDVHIPFTNVDGSARMWTVIVAENGFCKTTILQAIAAAALGEQRANQLFAGRRLHDLRDEAQPVEIESEFELEAIGHASREYPGIARPEHPPKVSSKLVRRPGWQTFTGSSSYVGQPTPGVDPFVEAAARRLPRWFVAGYGAGRTFHAQATFDPDEQDAVTARVQGLFTAQHPLISLGFADAVEGDAEAREFARLLKEALVDKHVLPRVTNFDRRGRGGANNQQQLAERRRFVVSAGSNELRLSATELADGYQGTIAWVADLIGHVVFEAGRAIELEHIEGLVLIDEIDLHLHPRWQLGLVRNLKRTFPRVQFVATTHSPTVLPGLDPGETIQLSQDEAGSIGVTQKQERPRTLTGSQLLGTFFGISTPFPDDVGRKFERYTFFATDAARSDQEENEMQALLRELRAAGIEPEIVPVARTNP